MPPTDPAQSLCLSCGLCCDGSLFWGVSLEEGEVSPSPGDEAGVLRQPCACFDGACMIYSARPAECRAFTCHVLDALTEGPRDRDWALAQIAGMRRILAALDAVLPGREPSLYRRVAEFLAAHETDLEEPEFREQHKEILLWSGRYEEAVRTFRDLDEPA